MAMVAYHATQHNTHCVNCSHCTWTWTKDLPLQIATFSETTMLIENIWSHRPCPYKSTSSHEQSPRVFVRPSWFVLKVCLLFPIVIKVEIEIDTIFFTSHKSCVVKNLSAFNVLFIGVQFLSTFTCGTMPRAASTVSIISMQSQGRKLKAVNSRFRDLRLFITKPWRYLWTHFRAINFSSHARKRF